jgi:hypothetical protein
MGDDDLALDVTTGATEYLDVCVRGSMVLAEVLAPGLDEVALDDESPHRYAPVRRRWRSTPRIAVTKSS